MKAKQLAEFLVEQRVLEPSQAEDVLSEVELNGKTVVQAMTDGGFIDEGSFYQTIANGLGTDFVDLTERDIAPAILRLIPSGLARLHGALPVEMSGTTLRVALIDPFDLQVAEDLRFALGKDIQVVVSPEHQIEDLIKQHYGSDTTSMDTTGCLTDAKDSRARNAYRSRRWRKYWRCTARNTSTSTFGIFTRSCRRNTRLS